MRDFARGVHHWRASHALSLKEALQMANAILSRPNRRFGIMEAVRLAHAKGWQEAELTGLAA